MKTSLIVIDEEYKDLFKNNDLTFMTPMQYILGSHNIEIDSKTKVYNLSSSYAYQDLGYYVSLLATARDQKVFPTPTVIQDLKDRKIRKLFSEEIYELIQTKLKQIKSDEFTISVYFGKNLSEKYDKIAWELYRIVKAPLFKVELVKQEEWSVKKIKLLSIDELAPSHLDFMIQAAGEYLRKNRTIKSTKQKGFFDLAILHNEKEEACPSNKKALNLFLEAFKKAGFRSELVQHSDKVNIAEYDALFIRETTNVTHHTYRMARNAEKEGLVVIDDPQSIVECTNKIFLEELMDRLKIQRPKTQILDKKLFNAKINDFEYPCVIKKPDSAFSMGVHKAKNVDQLKELANELFKVTELVLIQEFLPTDYDWRIGVLGGEVIYACKYFMAKDHWQIANNSTTGDDSNGETESIDPKLVDPEIIKVAIKLTEAIGDGLYGVDIKQKGSDIYVIEVNDNPSIDAGIEDGYLGKELYEKIANHFYKQCCIKRGLNV